MTPSSPLGWGMTTISSSNRQPSPSGMRCGWTCRPPKSIRSSAHAVGGSASIWKTTSSGSPDASRCQVSCGSDRCENSSCASASSTERRTALISSRIVAPGPVRVRTTTMLAMSPTVSLTSGRARFAKIEPMARSGCPVTPCMVAKNSDSRMTNNVVRSSRATFLSTSTCAGSRSNHTFPASGRPRPGRSGSAGSAGNRAPRRTLSR
jgi:hypothetical protein